MIAVQAHHTNLEILAANRTASFSKLSIAFEFIFGRKALFACVNDCHCSTVSHSKQIRVSGIPLDCSDLLLSRCLRRETPKGKKGPLVWSEGIGFIFVGFEVSVDFMFSILVDNPLRQLLYEIIGNDKQLLSLLIALSFLR
eukprot:GHVT01019810.1.p2 GENE.GHVT01019810.1~~GHVT01019810.1.p2  ORF type:complete len:141 (-),score=1.00 GHVT01019810.1:1901-2323(-)